MVIERLFIINIAMIISDSFKKQFNTKLFVSCILQMN